VNSGLNGAKSGSDEFFKGKPVASLMTSSARSAVCPAVLGMLVGVFSAKVRNEKRSVNRSLVFGVAGCAVGFAAGVAWKNRQLAASVAQGAAKNIGRVRQEHWMEQNSIAYA
jgi:hypothetical protein